jgi:hypothetical protein
VPEGEVDARAPSERIQELDLDQPELAKLALREAAPPVVAILKEGSDAVARHAGVDPLEGAAQFAEDPRKRVEFVLDLAGEEGRGGWLDAHAGGDGRIGPRKERWRIANADAMHGQTPSRSGFRAMLQAIQLMPRCSGDQKKGGEDIG